MSRQFYDEFARIVSGAGHDPAMFGLEKLEHASRLAVYRNNVATSAIEALRAAYPVVNALTGARFFSPLAKAFWQSAPPRIRSLTGYGEGFADHVADYEPARGLPYLAEIARLDRAWLEAHLAADGPPRGPAQVAALSPGMIADLAPGLHPSARLLTLSWPVHDIWWQHRSGRSAGKRLDLEPAAQAVLVWRPYGDVRSIVLDPGTARFLVSLQSGGSLAEASHDALARYPDFDPAAVFRAALSAGYLSGDTMP